MTHILSPCLLLLTALRLHTADKSVPPPTPPTTPSPAIVPAARLPLPPSESIEAAQRDLRETLKDDYASARKPEDRLLLARKLLAQALTMSGADTERHVMLREAADLAARAGDASIALEAVDEQAQRFIIPLAEKRLRILVLALAKPASIDSALVGGDALCGLVDDAIVIDDYAFAQRAAKEADAFSRRLKDPSFAARTKLLLSRVKLLDDEFKKVGAVTADLLSNIPVDAHLRLGRFLCFIKGDWPRGLPHLAAGDDADLTAVAQTELTLSAESAALAKSTDPTAATKVTEPAALLKIADGWYDVSQKQHGQAKDEIQAHALAWYRRAATTLQGPARLKLDKRLEELERALSTTGRSVRYLSGAVLLLTFERETLAMQGLHITQVLDVSGHNLRAVASGIPTIETAGYGNALNLDGKSWLTIGNTKELQIAGNQTIAFWMRPLALELRQNPFNKSYGDEGTMTLEPGGLLNYFYGTAGTGGADQAVAMPAAGVVKRWTHVVLVRDLTAQRLTWYKNGKKDVEVAAKYPVATVSSYDLLIGNGYLTPFVGQLDDVGVWARTLSPVEIRQLYEATSAGR
ncbi:MAG TPA: LamG domain-containing protein [Planctomycetota bacterium]|nr:LamG domain-containing protein [Planctomycetota bacterium]